MASGAAERCARQRGVQAEQPWRTRQDQRAADVGNQADTDLRHRHLRGVGDHSDAAVDGDPDAAAHHDAVHQRDIWLAEAADLRIQQILVVPEALGLGPVGSGAVIERDDVAARAQAAFACAVDHDGTDVVVAVPVAQHRRYRWTIGWVSELMAFGPVEGDQADAVVDSY